jgi:hypothetical protein
MLKGNNKVLEKDVVRAVKNLEKLLKGVQDQYDCLEAWYLEKLDKYLDSYDLDVKTKTKIKRLATKIKDYGYGNVYIGRIVIILQ